jgi:hypothetical protein
MYIPPLDVSITPPCPPLTKGRIVPGVYHSPENTPLWQRGEGGDFMTSNSGKYF